MGGVIELFIIMLIIAALAFAPLGFFIHRFTNASEHPLGDTEPHGDSPSAINDLAEKAMKFIQDRLAKK